jgi:hypothetical protein
LSNTRKLKVPRSLLDNFQNDRESQNFFKDLENRNIIGELYAETITTAITTAGTFYPIIGQTVGVQDKTSCDGTAGTITAQTVGDYSVNCAISFHGSVNTTYSGNIYVNGAAISKIGFTGRTSSASNIMGASMSGIIRLNSGDVVSVKVTSLSSTVSFITDNFNLNITDQT